jgi:hypothetical protein
VKNISNTSSRFTDSLFHHSRYQNNKIIFLRGSTIRFAPGITQTNGLIHVKGNSSRGKIHEKLG